MSHLKYFGTDGIRGIAGKELTPELSLKLGLASGYVLGKNHKKVLVGKDSRISGDMLTSAIFSGLMAMGLDVYNAGIVPTPAVSILTSRYGFDFGVICSASHNPIEDNGFKFFDANGLKINDELEDLIEKKLNESFINRPTGTDVGKLIDYSSAVNNYFDYVLGLYEIDLSRLKIVTDTAFGATSNIAPEVFSRLGAKVIAINNEYNGNLINVNCGSTNPIMVKRAINQNDADIGLAFDGDGDRVIVIDEKGEILTGDHLLAIIAGKLSESNLLRNFLVVGTVLSNQGLESYLDSLGAKLLRVNVGDKNIIQAMMEQNLVLGGERSGHIIIRDKSLTGDGIITALEILSIMASKKVPISALKNELTEFPQHEINHKTLKKHDLIRKPQLIELVNNINTKLGKEGRVIIRASGTEPILRVMIEVNDDSKIKTIADEIMNKIFELEED